MKKKSVGRLLYEYLIVIAAGIFNALAVHIFVNPNRFVPGGFTGIASLLYYIFPNISISILYFALNVPLLILSLVLLKGEFTVKTIVTTLACTLFLKIIPEKIVFTHSRLIACVLGGVTISVSMFAAYTVNSSNGGTEILARLVAKYRPERDVSSVILFANTVIVLSGSLYLFFFQGERLSVVFFSLLYEMLGAICMGIWSRGLDHPQKYLVFTRNAEALQEDILKKFGRGVTCVDLCDEEGNVLPDRKILLVVLQYRQSVTMKHLIKKHDPAAFTVVKDVYDVFSRPSFNRSYRYDKKI